MRGARQGRIGAPAPSRIGSGGRRAKAAPALGAVGSRKHYQTFLRKRAELIAAGKHANPSASPRAEYNEHARTGKW